jgi:transposase-like protein
LRYVGAAALGRSWSMEDWLWFPLPTFPPPRIPADQLDRVLERMHAVRFAEGPFCPHCRCRDVQLWGRASGRQRYRCTGCGRTFNVLTGTPAAYIKKLELWPDFCRAMEAGGESLRAAARRLGIHASTAFRWRHRLLNELRARDAEELHGWIEIGVLGVYPVSLKGQKGGLGRPARTRASWPWAHPPPETVGVAIATDLEDHVVTSVVGRYVLTEAEVEGMLGGRIRGRPDGRGPILVVHNNILRPYERFLESVALPGAGVCRAWKARVHCPPLAGSERLRIYWFRLRLWMARFRGVATRYLPNYLVWHRWLLPLRRPGASSTPLDALLRWPEAYASPAGPAP